MITEPSASIPYSPTLPWASKRRRDSQCNWSFVIGAKSVIIVCVYCPLQARSLCSLRHFLVSDKISMRQIKFFKTSTNCLEINEYCIAVFVSEVGLHQLHHVLREGSCSRTSLQQQRDLKGMQMHHRNGGKHDKYALPSKNPPASPGKCFFLSAITNPKAPPGTKDAQKSFNFDFSYWSHNVSCLREIATPSNSTLIERRLKDENRPSKHYANRCDANANSFIIESLQKKCRFSAVHFIFVLQ